MRMKPDERSLREFARLRASYALRMKQSSAAQENILDVRIRRPHPGAEQSIIRFPEPSANFPAHVHLDQRELLQILLVDPVEVGG
jgi:hypothetical protein